jgi:hypothetical protein
MFKKLITYLLIIVFHAGLVSSPAVAFYKIDNNNLAASIAQSQRENESPNKGFDLGIYSLGTDINTIFTAERQYGAFMNADGTATSYEEMGFNIAGKVGLLGLNFLGASALQSSGATKAIKPSEQGGLNLFKWNQPQTSTTTGWKEGDYMLYLPNQGSTSANWKANYGALIIWQANL